MRRRPTAGSPAAKLPTEGLLGLGAGVRARRATLCDDPEPQPAQKTRGGAALPAGPSGAGSARRNFSRLTVNVSGCWMPEQTPHSFSYQRPAKKTRTGKGKHAPHLGDTWNTPQNMAGKGTEAEEAGSHSPRAEEDPLPRGRLASEAVGRSEKGCGPRLQVIRSLRTLRRALLHSHRHQTAPHLGRRHKQGKAGRQAREPSLPPAP